jgi:hypothetical protein
MPCRLCPMHTGCTLATVTDLPRLSSRVRERLQLHDLARLCSWGEAVALVPGRPHRRLCGQKPIWFA